MRGSQALFATFSDRPERAVALAQAGQGVAPADCAVAVRLLAQEGRARARSGDREAAMAAIGRAEDTFARMVDQPTHSIFSFAAPYLPFYAGTSFLWLGQAGLAQVHARRAISLGDLAPQDWPVARVLARFDLATGLVRQGEPEHACHVGAQALELARHRVTQPVRDQARRLHAVLRPYRALAAVGDLGDGFRALDPQQSEG